MDTARLDRRVVLGLWRLLLAGLLLVALLPAAGVVADDAPTAASSVEPAPAGLPADVWASILVQTGQLTAADGAEEDSFGLSAAIGEDTVVVGAPYHDVGGNKFQGTAYVFGRDQGGANQWGLIKQLLVADGARGDEFGWSVGISGDTIIVGATEKTIGANEEQGAAYVFYRNQGGANNWGQVKQLLAGDAAAQQGFGTSVAIGDDTIVVGVPSDDVGSNQNQGSAYVFYRNQDGADQWGQVKKLTAGDGAASDEFGSALGISGDTIVVGAPYHTVGASPEQGSAYVFYRNLGGADAWGQVKQLIAADGAETDQFGYSVAISSDTIVVGAPYDRVGSNESQGSAYVLYRNQDGVDQWGQVRKLTAGDGAASEMFGYSAGIDGDSIVIGANEDDIGSNEDQGSAYLFRRNRGGADQWGQVKKLTAGDGAEGDQFGASAAVSGDTIVVGAEDDDVGGVDEQGSAYVFLDTPAKLKLRKTDQRDPIPAGWIVRYTISVTNAGKTALPLITVADTLPYRTIFVQAGQGGQKNGNRVTWKLKNVPAGATVELSLWLRTYSTTRGSILNQVTASADGVSVRATQSTLIVAPNSTLQPAEEMPPAD